MASNKDIEKRAETAKEKRAKYGPDLELDEYEFEDRGKGELESLDALSEDDRNLVREVGFDPSERQVSGSYLQMDNESILADVMMDQEGLEVLPISKALERYDWLSDYLWNLVDIETDKYTAESALKSYDGYFIRAEPEANIQMPVQTCLVLKRNRSIQNVHNIIIAEEGSEMHIVTGCATPTNTERSLHLGISEFYVKPHAKLSFTMVHKWSEQTDVRPRSAALVEKHGVFLSNYAILSSLKSIQTFPKVRLNGVHAKADLNSVVYGTKNSHYDVGGALSLEAPRANGKVLSRSIATEQSHVTARGDLIGLSDGTKARLECDGLLLSDEASIKAVPQLQARAEGSELSHEATVGKVGEEQLSYLMSRGLDEETATSLIVSGFVHLDIPDLPDELQASIDQAVEMSLKGGM